MKRKSIITIAILIIVCIISVPYLFNFPAGKKRFLSKLSKNTHYSLEADKLYFSWFGPQKVERLTAIAPNGIEYKIPIMSLDMPLWELYKEIPSIGITQIFNPTVIIPTIHPQSDKQDQSINTAMVIPERCSLSPSCKVFGEVHITDGKVSVKEWKNCIDVPKLEYICNRDRMILHAKVKFPPSGRISQVDIECGLLAQNFQLQAEEVPSDLLDLFKTPWSGISLRELLGPTLNMECSAQFINKSGPILLHLHSPKVFISQSGSVCPEYYLLEKPLTISMQLSDKVINSIFPLSTLQIDPIQEPVTITIGPQEIRLPLSLSTKIKDGFIHIGKITCINKNLLFAITAQILGIYDSKIDLWFADIPVCYADGILWISRFEIIVQEKYPLAIWGKLDYFQKKVNLVLAITEKTLRKVFGITSLPSDYVITCPIKGSFDDIQLDIGKLVKRLSILLAEEKIKKQLWKEGTSFFKEPAINPAPIQSIPGVINK